MPEPAPDTRPAGRRRVAEAAGRRPSPLTLLAVVVPLLTVAALAIVRPAATPPTSHPPSSATLDRATAVCPARLPGADDVRLGSTGLGSGDVAIRVGRQDDIAPIDSGVGSLTEREAVVVDASGDLAAGLVVARSGAGSAVDCDRPVPERWFTGAGASAEHSSTLTLTNPDKGPAVADVTVWDGSALVDVPALRGVRVPGSGTASFDLSQVVPSRDALALRVQVSRGRLSSSVVDQVDPLGPDRPVREWLPSQTAPATTSYVAGVGAGAADRTLTLANPGDSEVRVTLELVSADSEFAPSGLDEIALAPASVSEVDLSGVLRGTKAEGVQALRVEATGPVTASLRTRISDDLALSTAGPTISGEAAAALPAGSKRLVVVGATAPGVLTLQAWDEDGAEVVRERRVEINPSTAARVRLPDDAVMALVRLDRTDGVVSLEVSDRGLSVLPLAPLVTTSEVADVRPAQR
ncbi:DUF5719 family protein [Nocardioides KLBMP 9356]|uniref:DUF5719 family protein n=1 Tax=Nocardioides potassii TaxID=2911371 RepID=A0ABS9HEZ1_9ACTN|nr:DUF5719 family protein [Nocardioides potassii]MCF6378681.1 DUF5719 family protein [Nocardioides potassii]